MTRRHFDDMLKNTVAVTSTILIFVIIAVLLGAPMWIVWVLLVLIWVMHGLFAVAIAQYIKALEAKVRHLTESDDTFVN